MKNGVKMSDCRFYVNPSERMVVCVIPHTKDMLLDFIYEHYQFPDLDMYYAMNWRLKDKLEMPNSFVGKAVCAEEDEWNEELGRLLAFSRAKDKCYKSFYKRANLYLRTLDRRMGDMIDIFNALGLKLEDKQQNMEEEIEALTQK